MFVVLSQRYILFMTRKELFLLKVVKDLKKFVHILSRVLFVFYRRNIKINSYFCSSIKSRSLRLTHQPSKGCHGGQGTMRKNYINFKIILIMKEHLSNPDFATPVEFASIQDIVDKLNYSVGNPGWTSARAAHDMLLRRYTKKA